MPVKIRIYLLVLGLLPLAILTLPPGHIKGEALSLGPSLITLAFIFLTKNVILSLFGGLWAGALLISRMEQSNLIGFLTQGFFNQLTLISENLHSKNNLLILLFIITILSTTALLQQSGGFKALAQYLSRFSQSKRSSQIITILLGMVIFIDDYVNSIVVGSQMRGLTDRYGISREKLTFLVDATSAPIAGVAIISTWIGYEVGLFDELSKQLGLGLNGYAIFLDILILRFYCFMMLAFVWLNVLWQVDFGPMGKKEQTNSNHGTVTTITPAFDKKKPQGTESITLVLYPVAMLFAVLFIGFFIDSQRWAVLAIDPLSWLKLNFWKEMITLSQHNKEIMASAALAALICSLFLVRQKQPLKESIHTLYQGAKGALMPMAILLLAWSIKNSLQELATAQFFIQFFSESLPIYFVPAFIFLLAALIAFMTGTSYGTMAILLPITTPLAFHMEGGAYGIITMLSFAAVLDGAIFGDHTSPFSDTTIMSSLACECDPWRHVQTQFPYALFVATGATFLGYLLVSYGKNPWISYISFIAIASLFFVLYKNFGRYRPRLS